MAKFCQLWLTCENTVEADSIAQSLLDKHLIACAKQMPVTSDFNWHGKKDHNSEVLLIMDSHEGLFSQVEDEVAKLHSYETFNLQAIPVSKVSEKAQTWLHDELEKG